MFFNYSLAYLLSFPAFPQQHGDENAAARGSGKQKKANKGKKKVLV